MPDLQDSSTSYMRNNPLLNGNDLIEMNQLSSKTGLKVCHYDDVWEQYKMCFTIWHPVEEMNDSWIFENNKTRDFQVSKLTKNIDWIDVKYGKQMQPLKVTMTMMQ